MGNMTLSIPDELLERMRGHSEIKWSEIARRTFARQLDVLEMMDKLLTNSKLTENDVNEIGHKIKSEIAKRYK